MKKVVVNQSPSDVCSPSHQINYERDGTCFTKDTLVKLANTWNTTYGSAGKFIIKPESKSIKVLWNALNDRMKDICKGDGLEWCWIDKLPEISHDTEIMKSVRPVKPKEWYNKPYAWLSNYDIQAVMRQYQDDKTNLYKFLGVFPIDFAAKTAFNNCISDEICKLSLKNLYKRGTKFIGMIVNLDKHDEPGSHWTSFFLCIDPKLPSFGAYYYDSTFDKTDVPPPEIMDFSNKMKKEALEIATSIGIPNANFRIDYSKIKHQYKNSECGLFSMVYQIRWIRKLKKLPNTVFEDVVNIRMRDEDVHELRNILFRPNTKEEVDQLKGGKKKLNKTKKTTNK